MGSLTDGVLGRWDRATGAWSVWGLGKGWVRARGVSGDGVEWALVQGKGSRLHRRSSDGWVEQEGVPATAFGMVADGHPAPILLDAGAAYVQGSGGGWLPVSFGGCGITSEPTLPRRMARSEQGLWVATVSEVGRHIGTVLFRVEQASAREVRRWKNTSPGGVAMGFDGRPVVALKDRSGSNTTRLVRLGPSGDEVLATFAGSVSIQSRGSAILIEQVGPMRTLRYSEHTLWASRDAGRTWEVWDLTSDFVTSTCVTGSGVWVTRRGGRKVAFLPSGSGRRSDLPGVGARR